MNDPSVGDVFLTILIMAVAYLGVAYVLSRIDSAVNLWPFRK